MTVQQVIIKRNNQFPNNDKLPVLLYKNALQLPAGNPAKHVQHLFEKNNWGNTWVDGIFNYHHYHSNTHEVLGIITGFCRIVLGGNDGDILFLTQGDVLILPAGVAHKNVESSADFCCVGGYPNGRDYDINYGKAEEHPRVDENRKRVPLPDTDPVEDGQGTLFEYWMDKQTIH